MTTSIPEHEALKQAVLDVIVPYDTRSSIADILDEAAEDEDPDRPYLLHVKQRSLLFFDEKLTVYVVLQLPGLPEDQLKTLLAKLDVKVDVWAINSPGSAVVPEVSTNGRDQVYSVSVDKTDDPVILVKDDEKDQDRGVSVLVLWETSVVLNRPRIRIHSPAINIVASATLPRDTSSSDTTADYLPSFQPLDHNVFEPLRNLKSFKDNPPYLAASRLESVLPYLPAEAKSFNVRIIIPNSIPIVPAVSARTRFSRMLTGSGSFETIASLDFEVTPFVRLDVVLEQAKVDMPTGKVEQLMQTDLPLRCSSKDCITFMYRLHPIQQLVSSGLSLLPQAGNTGALDISINAKILISSTCISTISITWSTNIDFSRALNPSFGPPSQPINRQKRPNSLPFAQQPSATSTPITSTRAQTPGLTITITAPSNPVIVNKPFTWELFIRNSTSHPMKLAVIPLPRIPRATSTKDAYTRRHAPKSSTASFHPSERRHTSSKDERDLDIAQAVCDENVVYALQHSNGSDKDTGIVSLTAELRVGPLAGGCVHEARIKLVALKAGALKLEALRVVDLSRESENGASAITDMRDLPDVICVEGKGEE